MRECEPTPDLLLPNGTWDLARRLINHSRRQIHGGKIACAMEDKIRQATIVPTSPANRLGARFQVNPAIMTTNLFKLIASGSHEESAMGALFQRHDMEILGPPLPKKRLP